MSSSAEKRLAIIGAGGMLGTKLVEQAMTDNSLQIFAFTHANIPHSPAAVSSRVKGIKSDCFQLQQAEWQAKPALAGVTTIELIITSQLQDKFGNTSTGTIGTCTLTQPTEKLFNWGNLYQDTAWGDYDDVYILPSLNS